MQTQFINYVIIDNQITLEVGDAQDEKEIREEYSGHKLDFMTCKLSSKR